MSEILDWVTLNSWAVILAVATFAVAGYALTRPAALRGANGDDSNAWIMFCMTLYPDTRGEREDDVSEGQQDEADGQSGDGD